MKRTISAQARLAFILFLLGAIIGSLLDVFHVYRQVKYYPSPMLLGIAWWVPLLFGGATVVIGCSHPFIDPLIGTKRPVHSLMSSMSELAWLILVYLISASILDTLAQTALLFIIYMNFWLLAGGKWQNILLSAVTAITGTLVEMVLVAGGAFSYVHPDLLGVPFWLPCLYACASLAIGDIGRSLLSHATTRGQ